MKTQLTPFQLDLVMAGFDPSYSKVINGVEIPRAHFNLIVARQDLYKWAKGIRPNPSWKVGDVKKYFGINGRPDSMVEQIDQLFAEHFSV